NRPPSKSAISCGTPSSRISMSPARRSVMNWPRVGLTWKRTSARRVSTRKVAGACAWSASVGSSARINARMTRFASRYHSGGERGSFSGKPNCHPDALGFGEGLAEIEVESDAFQPDDVELFVAIVERLREAYRVESAEREVLLGSGAADTSRNRS